MSYLPNHFQNNALLHVTLSDILTIKVDIVQRKFIDGCDSTLWAHLLGDNDNISIKIRTFVFEKRLHN